ncbi:MAG: MFS transporter [Cyclobacteriaceae bacterium]
MKKEDIRQLLSVPVIVAALGYFVDIYDLLLFGIVRKPSLIGLGIPDGEQVTNLGEYLLQVQMGGLLVGGIIWGILGDKRGRLSVLFGSILLYSLANIANGFVTNITQYEILRFIAGIGLAGELGAGVTLVAEILPTRLRGYGTMLIAAVGVLGAVVANIVVKEFDWRVAYFIGGGLGLLLLIARVSVFESGIFLKLREHESKISRGNFFMLFNNKGRFLKFMGCIFIGLPLWYGIGILVTFSPEFAKALGIEGAVTAGNSIMYSYLGLTVGGIMSGVISQNLESRKKTVALFVLIELATILIYLYQPNTSVNFFYVTTFLLGIGFGYWAIFVTVAAEQFGTNLRSTVATTTPNFIRGTVIPLTLLFHWLREDLQLGWITGALIIGIGAAAIALLSLLLLQETFHRDLNFVEED